MKQEYEGQKLYIDHSKRRQRPTLGKKVHELSSKVKEQPIMLHVSLEVRDFIVRCCEVVSYHGIPEKK